MEEKYLVINAGSSSLKFTLYRIPEKSVVVNGYIEKLGKKDVNLREMSEKQKYALDYESLAKEEKISIK